MRARIAARGFVVAWLVATTPACSVVFSADDLSKGSGGGGHGHGGGGSGPVACHVDADCDDGRDCTNDTCKKGSCVHDAAQGKRCGVATDCTPAGTCNAEGNCAPGEPDPRKCDDHNSCTDDRCEVSGCTHEARTGKVCTSNDPCDDQGTCNAAGQCIASPKPDVTACGGTCPGDFYVADHACDPFCGGCLCVNSVVCRFACKPSFEACCELGDDLCSNPCPSGYHAATAPRVIAGQCACGDKSVSCVQDAP